MRVRIVGLPHTELRFNDYAYCAYTAKIIRFADMLYRDGRHKPIVYAEGDPLISDVHPCVEQHRVPFDDVLEQETGEAPWTGQRQFDNWDVNSRLWREWNERCIVEMSHFVQPGDAVGIIAGLCQRPVAEHFRAQGHPILEWGIGYSGVLPAEDSFKVYESNSWRSALVGPRGEWRAYDRVIPNAYGVTEFMPAGAHQNYLLYMGRLNADKGIDIVRAISEQTDLEVFVAGQGDPSRLGDRIQYLGVLSGSRKRQALACATAVLVPSQYLEPFGGVAVEAQMSGTPAITTDWAAFAETVQHGVTGYRANTLNEFLAGVEWAQGLLYQDRIGIQLDARRRFSTDMIQNQYGAWLDDIEDLYNGGGWYGRRS